MTLSDLPDVKLAVLQRELELLTEMENGEPRHTVSKMASGRYDYKSNKIFPSLSPIKDWLESRFVVLKEEVREMRLREARAHSVDEALLDAPSQRTHKLVNPDGTPYIPKDKRRIVINRSYMGWMADDDDFTNEGC